MRIRRFLRTYPWLNSKRANRPPFLVGHRPNLFQNIFGLNKVHCVQFSILLKAAVISVCAFRFRLQKNYNPWHLLGSSCVRDIQQVYSGKLFPGSLPVISNQSNGSTARIVLESVCFEICWDNSGRCLYTSSRRRNRPAHFCSRQKTIAISPSLCLHTTLFLPHQPSKFCRRQLFIWITSWILWITSWILCLRQFVITCLST